MTNRSGGAGGGGEPGMYEELLAFLRSLPSEERAEAVGDILRTIVVLLEDRRAEAWSSLAKPPRGSLTLN